MVNSLYREPNVLPLKLSISQTTLQYRLQVATMQEYAGNREEHQYVMDLALAYKINTEGSISCTLDFSLPEFNAEQEYNKEQWLYTKLGTVHERLVLQINRFGKIMSVANPDQILQNWETVKKDLSDQNYSQSPQVAEVIEYLEHNFRNNMQGVYTKDPCIQWICNDLFQHYKMPGMPVTTRKQLHGHFGLNELAIDEHKSINTISEDQLEIQIEGDLVTDEMDIAAINYYIGAFTGDTGNGEYDFSYSGSYAFDLENNSVSDGHLRIDGGIEGIYQKTIKYQLNRL